MFKRINQSNNDCGEGERTGLVAEKAALNAADIYRSAGWGGSEMWPRLPDRLNVLFIVQLPVFFEDSVSSVKTRIYQKNKKYHDLKIH